MFLPHSVTVVEVILTLHNELLVEQFMPRIENGEKSIFSVVEVLPYEVSGKFTTGLLMSILGEIGDGRQYSPRKVDFSAFNKDCGAFDLGVPLTKQ